MKLNLISTLILEPNCQAFLCPLFSSFHFLLEVDTDFVFINWIYSSCPPHLFPSLTIPYGTMSLPCPLHFLFPSFMQLSVILLNYLILKYCFYIFLSPKMAVDIIISYRVWSAKCEARH